MDPKEISAQLRSSMRGKTKWVNARRFVRRMRGKAQALLIEADDGCAYVVKLTNNPQGGRRELVNEFIGAVLLTDLGVATPEPAFIQIDDQCVSSIGPLPTGVHFGSRYPGTPDTVSVYDFLPDVLLPNVINRPHFIGALMFDLWVSNADARQAIFFREFSSPHESTPTKRRWVAQMIDNGSGFGGTDWTFRESPVHCRHGRCAGYGLDISIRASAPWLDALMELRLDMLNEAVAELPRDWIRGDERALDAVLARLYERRSRVPAMILQARLLAASQSVARDPNVLS